MSFLLSVWNTWSQRLYRTDFCVHHHEDSLCIRCSKLVLRKQNRERHNIFFPTQCSFTIFPWLSLKYLHVKQYQDFHVVLVSTNDVADSSLLKIPVLSRWLMGCDASLWWSTIPVGSRQVGELCTWFTTEKRSPQIPHSGVSDIQAVLGRCRLSIIYLIEVE